MKYLNLQSVLRTNATNVLHNNYNQLEKKSMELKGVTGNQELKGFGIGQNKWSKDSHIKINIQLDMNDVIKAGDLLKGTILLECFTCEFVLLDLKVAILGVEEMIGKIYPTTNSFLLSLASVMDHDKLILENFDRYGCKKPIIEFPFELQVAQDIPSSFKHPYAAIRYFIFCQANIRYLNTGVEKSLFNQIEVKIIEKCNIENNPTIIGEYYKKYKPFHLNLNGFSFSAVIPNKYNIAGFPIKLRINGSNTNKLKIKEIKIQLNRSIILLKKDLINVNKIIFKRIEEIDYKSKLYLDQLNSPEFDFNLSFDIPPHVKSISNSIYFQVNYTISIKIGFSYNFKAVLELPLVILNPASVV
ncbi:hypothetical protein K502DRAFT_340193, partial [Neoconidiobolus thromboides FSU 785]